MKPNPPLPLIWGVFLMTQFLITGVSFVVPAEPTLEPTWAYLFGFPALFTAGLSVAGGLLRRFVANEQTWYILRWALAETATLLGFVSWFTSGERIVQIPCVALAVVAIAVAFPRPESAR